MSTKRTESGTHSTILVHKVHMWYTFSFPGQASEGTQIGHFRYKGFSAVYQYACLRYTSQSADTGFGLENVSADFPP